MAVDFFFTQNAPLAAHLLAAIPDAYHLEVFFHILCFFLFLISWFRNDR
jgi:hypothetical protein